MSTVDIQQQARALARAQCASSRGFATLTHEEQRDLYLDTVKKHTAKLSRQAGLATAMADKGAGAEMGFKDYDPGFDGSTKAFNELVDSVDFPKFVADLLKAVFDANLSVMKAQTDDYIRLMKEATKSTADFIKKVGDEESFAYLAEAKNDQFNIALDADGSMSLTNPQGEKLDVEDNEVKAAIMDAKIAMAKEHRAALREVILMGVTRLIIDKGEVEAGVEFKITANRDSKKSHSDKNINTVGVEAQGGSVFWSAKSSMQNTNIQINTSDKTAKDELTAKLIGKVNIKFKTDYFKLDNFAQMYGNGGTAAFAPQGGGGAPALPPGGGTTKP